MAEELKDLGEEIVESPLGKLELAILVLDGSGSMGEKEAGSDRTKAESVEFHLVGEPEKSLIDTLAASSRANEFQLAVVTFDHNVKRVLEPTPMSTLDRGALKLNLLQNHGGATAIGSALKEADAIAAQFLAEEKEKIPRYVVILLMTDGREEGPQTADPRTNPVAVAEEIKAKAKTKCGRPDVIIAAAAYGNDADEETLRSIVTSPLKKDAEFFRKVESGKELRQFFGQSMKVVDQLTQ